MERYIFTNQAEKRAILRFLKHYKKFTQKGKIKDVPNIVNSDMVIEDMRKYIYSCDTLKYKIKGVK